MSAARVLVVSDGETPHVLPAIRSLARAGFLVGLATPPGSARQGAGSAKLATRHDVPTVQQSLDDYLTAVAAVVHDHGYDVVLPGDDADLLALSWGRARIDALLPYAAHDVVQRAVDKLDLVHLAADAGLAVPRTVPADDAAVASAAPPLIVKARLHWSPETPGDGGRHRYAIECASRDELTRAVAVMRASGGRPLLQERVDGELSALSLVMGTDGALLAVSQQRTQRLSTRRTSVRAVTVDVDAELAERARTMLAGLGWRGLANLQFLQPPGGPAYLIDLNGRFYGSLALAIRAGADLPAVWVDDALGRRTGGGVQVARAGVRFHAFEEDLRRARRDRRNGLLVDLTRVALSAPGSAHTTWSAGDPRPALQRLRALSRTLLDRPEEDDRLS